MESGYLSVCDRDKVNIYDGITATITVSEEAVIKGCRCPYTKLWRISLRYQVTDLNMHTLVLNGTTGLESLNSMYTVPLSASVLDHTHIFNKDPARPAAGEAINNVYELPSMERAVRYLHAAVGFSTKETWINSIHNGNYITWLLITVKNVNKHFPELE